MGLPVHSIRPKTGESWIETLRYELNGYATVETVGDPTEDSPTVYVIGNHGYFLIRPQGYHEDSCLLLMFPFCCDVRTFGQDMVNLEERIHRIFDSMSIACTPEFIERYEKSRWTKFFRLFGWEHVGSLDFAHRLKTEIVEGDFDGEPIRSRFTRKTHIRCKPNKKESWLEIFRQRLAGKSPHGYCPVFICSADFEPLSSRTIISPNDK